MSEFGNTQKNPGGKKDSESKSIQPGPSKLPYTMGRPPIPPIINLNFPRHTHFYTNRTHDPNEKMKTWFTNEHHNQESRSSSWMVQNSPYKPVGGSELSNTEDFWENDLSDDLINQIMNDNFEESLLKTSQGTNSKSHQESGRPKFAGAVRGETRSKLHERLGFNPKLCSSSSQSRGASNKSRFPNPSTLNLSARSSSSSSIFSENQKKLLKPTKSFNLQNSQSLTTEWLRNQLEKVNKECKSLKESISSKDGENKILREKLNDAKITIEKQKMDKEIECLNIKTTLEEKIKLLKKDLQSAKTQILFKSKEAESNIERYKGLKKMNLIEPEFSQSFSSSQCLKKFMSKNEKPKTSLETTSIRLSELSEKNLHAYKTESVQSVCTQTEMEMEIEELSSKDNDAELILNFIKEKVSCHYGNELTSIISPNVFKSAKPEYSILIPPAIDYYPFDILFRDVSEFPKDDNDEWSVQANLAKLWNVQENIGKKKNPKEAIRKSCYFSSLCAIHLDLFEVCRLHKWENSSSVHKIIKHVTNMARELYIAFRDPAVLASRTIRTREIQTHYSCLDITELEDEFNIYSPAPYKNEIYVDLRRGIALIAAMCDIDPKVQKLILKESNFFFEDKSDELRVESFSLEEKCNITCITDTFTNELEVRTTFLHHKAFEFQSVRVKDIAKRAEKNRKKQSKSHLRFSNPETSDFPMEVPKESKVLNINNMNNIISTILTEVKSNLKCMDNFSKAIVEENPRINLPNKKCKDLILDFDSKIDESLIKALQLSEKKTAIPEEASSSKSEEIKDDVMKNLIKKELEVWTSSSVPEKISKNVLRMCSSVSEKELICSIFNNFLQIKASMDGDEIPLLTDDDEECSIVDSDVKEPNTTEDEVTQTRKRKISSEAQPTTSKDSTKPSEGSRKRDLAPLKKPRKDENAEEEIDTQDIQNELEMIYQEEKIENPLSEAEILNFPAKQNDNHPVTNEFEESESGRMYEYLYPEEIASQCELLAILLEVVRSISCFRYTISFKALLVSIVKLLNSLKVYCFTYDIKVHYLFTIVLEIIYCRPSPLVILEVNRLFCNYIPIIYFARMICHNAHPAKFVTKHRKIEFKRGACLLSMICSLIELYAVDTNWEIHCMFFHWIYHLFLVDVTVITRIYQRQRTTSGHCSCVQVLDNCILKILTEAVVSYYGFWKEKKLGSFLKSQIDSIIKQGVKILSVILEIDKYFIQNMSHKYKSFVSFLETVYFFHLSKDIDFKLQKIDLHLLRTLLDDKVIKQGEKRYDRESNLQIATGIFSNHTSNLRSKLVSLEK